MLLKLHKEYTIVISLKNFWGRLIFTSTTKDSSPKETIAYICGLRARIECEPFSEHSTHSDRVTNIGYGLFGRASPLPAARQKFPYKITYSLYFLRSLSKQFIVIFVPSASYSVSFTVAFSLK